MRRGVRRSPAEPLFADELVLLGPTSDPAKVGDAPVAAARLGEIPLILPAQPHGLRVLVDEVLAKLGVPPKLELEVEAMTATLSLVEQGAGYTILSETAAQHLLGTGRIRSWPIVDPVITRQLVLATSTQRPMSVATRVVSRMLREQARSAFPLAAELPQNMHPRSDEIGSSDIAQAASLRHLSRPIVPVLFARPIGWADVARSIERGRGTVTGEPCKGNKTMTIAARKADFTESGVPLALRIAQAAQADRQAPLSPKVREKLQLCLLDFLSCALESRGLPWARQAAALAEGEGRCTIIGTPRCAFAGDAAFANAVAGHGLVREDMHAGAVSHLGVAVLPALLAMAEDRAISGAAFAQAAVVGYEVGAKIGRAIVNPDFHQAVPADRLHRPDSGGSGARYAASP